MNFLAHLVLAPQTPEGWAGAIAPDMVRGPLPKDMRPGIAEAAHEHQRIDAFTDAHPAFLHTREALCAYVQPRLAGIVADVLFDHVLAGQWSDWCDDTLAGFVGRAEGGLVDQMGHVPVRMRMIVQTMIDERWLMSYASAEGIRARLATMSARLSQRVGREMVLDIGADELARVYPVILYDFKPLWTDLKLFVDKHRQDRADRLASSIT